ncbi:MAG: glycosyltransferase [Thalassobaculales bacterium]
MHILHVIQNLAPHAGGPAMTCLESAKLMAARGHRVTIATTNYQHPGAQPGIAVVEGVEIRTHPVQFPAYLRTSWPLKRDLAAILPQVDICRIHLLWTFVQWAAFAECRRAGVPWLVQPHGNFADYHWRWNRARKAVMERLFQDRMLEGAAGVIYTAEAERMEAGDRARGAPAFVLPHGIHIGRAVAPPAGTLARLWPALAGRRVVLFMSRLHAKKGLPALAGAFARLAATRPDLALLVCGGDYGAEAAFRRQIAALGIAHRVVIAGHVEGTAKAAAFAESTLFCLPSLAENFGNAIVEAMAFGLPVVTTAHVDIAPDIAPAARIGTPDADSMAALMAGLLDDPAAAAALGRAGQRLVAERYAWPVIADRMEAIYEATRRR